MLLLQNFQILIGKLDEILFMAWTVIKQLNFSICWLPTLTFYDYYAIFSDCKSTMAYWTLISSSVSDLWLFGLFWIYGYVTCAGCMHVFLTTDVHLWLLRTRQFFPLPWERSIVKNTEFSSKLTLSLIYLHTWCWMNFHTFMDTCGRSSSLQSPDQLNKNIAIWYLCTRCVGPIVISITFMYFSNHLHSIRMLQL